MVQVLKAVSQDQVEPVVEVSLEVLELLLVVIQEGMQMQQQRLPSFVDHCIH
jgi:hypothetical protein